jgi:hypothetical protein
MTIRCSIQGRLSKFQISQNINLAGANTHAYFTRISIDEDKKFFDTDTWSMDLLLNLSGVCHHSKELEAVASLGGAIGTGSTNSQVIRLYSFVTDFAG